MEIFGNERWFSQEWWHISPGERLEELLQRIDTNGDGMIQLEVRKDD